MGNLSFLDVCRNLLEKLSFFVKSRIFCYLDSLTFFLNTTLLSFTFKNLTLFKKVYDTSTARKVPLQSRKVCNDRLIKNIPNDQ